MHRGKLTMKKTILFSLLLALPWVSVAETEEKPETPTAQTEEVAQEPAPILFEAGEQFNDWSVNCLYALEEAVKEGKRPKKGVLRDCQSTQIFTTENNQQIMRLYMLFERAGENVAENPSLYFHIPLRAFLQPQVAIQVDENNAVVVPYNFCDEGGCYAGGQLDSALVEQMQKGENIKIVFFNDQRQPISLDLSLAGYTKAVNYLTENAKNIGKEVRIPKN